MANQYVVEGRKINLVEESWDYLIILDACRYDYFEDVYRKYFDRGELRKAVSPATSTIEWLVKTFPGKYENIVYISANGLVNSELEVGDFGYSFKARDHFKKIVDAWDWGWDKITGTVHPDTLNKAVIKINQEYPNKRIVVHYEQPHYPFIGKKYKRYFSEGNVEGGIGSVKGVNPIKKYLNKFRSFIGEEKLMKTRYIRELLWKANKVLGFTNVPQKTLIGSREGINGIRKAYKENLITVLGEVSDLVGNLPGEFLITADHGEYLGEDGWLLHGNLPRKAPITEVPYFEIKNKKEGGKISGHVGERANITHEKIKRRLSRLGYH